MSNNNIAVARVVAVLLTDGWHRIIPGSFSVGPLGFGGNPDPHVPGFRFEESEAGSPYQPKVVAGPLGSVIAVRQVNQAVRGEPDRAWAPGNGQQADHGARLLARAGT
jgi:hypothetical protein